MRSAAAVLILSAVLQAVAAAQSAPSIPDRQIVTGEDIRMAGAFRLGDLFRLIDGWTVVQRDAWHADVTAGALEPAPTGTWELWIDGHRAGTPVFGARNINMLPLAAEDIAYVEVFTAPEIVEGLLVGRGVLHIHTKAAQPTDRRGVRVRGSTWVGNESGDPGPLRFLKDETPNVDHLGPDNTISSEYAAPNLRLYAGGVRRKSFPTDAAIRDRHLAMASSYPVVELYGAAVQAHSGGHQVAVHASQLDDFLFVKPFGRELPARTTRLFAGVNGAVGSGARLQYRASLTRTSLDPRPNPLDFEFDWRMDRLDGTATWHSRLRTLKASAGILLDGRRVYSGSIIPDPSLLVTGAHVALASAATDRLRPGFALEARTDGDDVFFCALASFEGRVGESHAFYGVLSIERTHPAEDHSLWFWTHRGYELLESLGVDHSGADRVVGSRTAALDVRWRNRWTHDWSTTAGLFVRSFSDRFLEIQRLTYDPQDASFSGPVFIDGPHAGRVAGLEGTLEGRIGPVVRQRFHARLSPYRSGSRALRDALARYPEFEADAVWFITPASSFSISPQIRVRSDTFWTEYADAEAESDGAYRAYVPWSWTIDLTTAKSLWDRRIRLTMNVRNLLNRLHRDHPIGASYDLSLSILAAVRFGT